MKARVEIVRRGRSTRLLVGIGRSWQLWGRYRTVEAARHTALALTRYGRVRIECPRTGP